MQRSRRTNPYPFTWEIPLAALVGVLLVLILGAHAGRALANLLGGAGLAFTPNAALFTSLVPILRGDAAAGLPSTVHAASPTALRTWIAVVETIVAIGLGWAAKAALERWGPGRVQGMASPTEAEQLLGRTRLRKVSAVVRPDLYGKQRTR